MSDLIKHRRTATWPEGVTAEKLHSSNWNDSHTLEGGAHGQFLKRDTGETDGWSWGDPLAQVDLLAAGVAADGVTDDTVAIQDAIDGSTAGSTIVFPPGVCLVSSPIVYKGSRAYIGSLWGNSAGSQIKQAAGSDMDSVFRPESYDSDFAASGSPTLFRDLYIDGNRANNAGSTHGLRSFNFNTHIVRVQVRDCDGDGIRFEGGAAFEASANTCVENWVLGCRVVNVGGIGIDVVNATGDKMTDGFIDRCIVQTTTSHGIYLDASSGWSITNNHLYQIGRTGIWAVFGFQTDIAGNYIETYGQTVDAGTYYGINASSLLSENAVLIRGNRINHKSSVGGNTYFGVQIRAANAQTTARFLLSGNFFRLNGGETGIVLGVGSGGALMEGEVVGNHLYNVGTTKVSQGAGVTASYVGNSFNRGTAAPVAGAWPVGMRVYDEAPAAGGTEGWVCTAAGSPGTWKAFGSIAA